MTTVSDDFNRSDSTSLGSNWTLGTGTSSYQIVSNQVTYLGGTMPGYIWNANTFSGNQFAQLTIVTLPQNEYAPGPHIRSPDTFANGAGYGLSVRSDGAVRLARSTSVVYTSSAGAFANGDVVRIEDRGGGNIVIVKNGTDYYTGYTDGSPLTGTYIGMYAYYLSSGSPNYVIDNWSGGDLDAASIVPQAMANYRMRAI